MLEALERAGLRPIGIDLSAFGMIRALAGADGDAVGAGAFVAAPAPSYEERMAGAEAPLPGVDEGRRQALLQSR